MCGSGGGLKEIAESGHVARVGHPRRNFQTIAIPFGPDLDGKDKGATAWPLPEPEVRRNPKSGRERYPALPLLIDIAIAEKRLDDVVELYGTLRQRKRWGRETDKKVVRAVAKSYPDVALGIWRDIADGLIALVKPKAYEEAAGYLRQMHKVYAANKRLAEWQELIQRLRVQHKAKRRLMEVLDGLEKKKIIG